MATVYLGLGSNLGNREEILQQAITAIEKQIGSVVSLSAFYETPPWGFDSPQPFLNAAVAVDTPLAPVPLLDATQTIERTLGRKSKSSKGIYSDRPIDIDILFYDNLIVESDCLTLPHPLLHLRTFVLAPLVEIAPTLIHPVLKRSIQDLFLEMSKKEPSDSSASNL